MKRVRLAILASHPIPYQVPLYRRLARERGLDLLVFYGDDYGKTPRYSGWGVENFTWAGGIDEGYPHVFVPNRAPRPDPSSFAGKLNPGLFSALRRYRPDAVLFTGYASIYHLQGALSSELLSARKLYYSDSNRMPASTLRGLAKRAFLSLFYRRMDALLAIGVHNRLQYLAYGVPEAKIFRFPYAVDNAHFRAEAERLRPERAALRRRFGVPDEATCVLFTGRLSPEKNVAELIRGVAAAPGQFLLLAGSGPEQAALARLAEERIPGRHRFTGFLNYDRIAEGYAAADVFALTSRDEPWGLVCNEAMNFGLPIVLSDRVGAAPDLVSPGETGLIYTCGDTPGLTRALVDVEAMLRRDPGKLSRATVAKIDLYTQEAQVKGLLEALGVRGREASHEPLAPGR